MNDITSIKQGDAGVFREVYEQFHVKVFRYFLKRTTVHETATELTQQLFIKLWQSRHTLSDNHTLEVQLFTMVNSVWIDHLRKEATSRKNVSSVPDFDAVTEHRQDDAAWYALETNDHLQQAIQQLPPVRRKVFILKILHGFSNKEIAGNLSVSVKTVEDHLWKAVRHIRAVMSSLWTLLLIFIQ